MQIRVEDGMCHILIVLVSRCSLEYHSQMVSDAVKRVIKQGKVSVFASLQSVFVQMCLVFCLDTNITELTVKI